MYVWEWQLMVLRRACEFRLDSYRERHSRLAEERRRSPHKGPAWEAKSQKMALVRQFIYRELDEIKHIKQRANAGPIKGGTLVLWIRDAKGKRAVRGPSIIDIITRQIDYHRDEADKTDNEQDSWRMSARADGLELALEILANPYRFLTEDERAAYDAAESNAAEVTQAAGRRLADREDRASDVIQRPALPTPEQLRARGAGMVARRGQ